MDYLKKITIHLLLLLAFFGLRYQIVFAQAPELLIEPEIIHAGLNFDNPLKIDKPENLRLIPLTIAFGEQEYKAEEPTPTPVPDEATPTPSSTPKTTTKQLTPTPTTAPATPTTQPTQSVQSGSNTSTGGLNADVLFNMSNSYRASKGLPPFQTDSRICSLAAARAPEIGAEIFGGYMHAGKDSHNFPYRFTENIITMRTEAEAFNWWVNDYIHRVQIEAANTHSCVACSGNECTQEFTSFQPK